MLKNTLGLLMLMALVIPTQVKGQDQAARKILDKLVKKYDGYKTMELDLEMIQSDAENRTDKANVKIIQKGNSFVFTSPEQAIYCNEHNVWFHLIKRNEVQINDYDYDPDDYTVVTPKDLLRQYNSGKYDYILIEESTKSATIEFKPRDRDSDYAKFKIEVDKLSDKIAHVTAFSKDGSKVVFNLKNQKTNASYPSDFFTFNPAKHPGIHVEDLRIN